MKTLILAILVLSANAYADTCNIEAQWVDCREPATGAQYDYGCSVDCGEKQSVCVAATTFPILNPNGHTDSCQLIPSACYCN